MVDENLGNLKYSLHLDTSEFDKQVQDAEKKVDALAKVVESKANATSKKNADSSGDKQTEQYLQKVQQLADNAQEAIRKMTAQQEKFGEGTTAYKNIGEQIQRLTSYMDMLKGIANNNQAKDFLNSSGADKAASEYMKIYDVILKVNGEINKLDIANIKGVGGDEVAKVRQEWEQLYNSLSQMASGKVVSGDMTTRLDAIGRSITELQQKTAKAIAIDKEAAKAKEKIGAKDPYQTMLSTLDKVNAELVRINNLKTIASAKGLDTSGYEKALGILQQIAAEMEKIKSGGGSVSSGQLSGWSSMFTQAKSYAATQTALNRTLDEGKGKANDFVAGVRQMNAELNNQQGIWSQLKPLIGDVFSVYAVKQFLDAIIDVGGEIQKQKLAMASILGDQGEADQLFTQMRGLAVQSPFGILDLVKSTKQLSAFGVEANELYDTMKRLSDISAGVGVDVSRLAYAFGQVKSRTWLDAKELRQISYTGIPMLSELTKYLNSKDNTEKTTAEVRDMISKRQVSFDDMKAVLWKMTDEGGQFYDMQKVISQSVAAKYKNMHDAIDLFMNDLAENNSEVLKAPAEAVTTLVRNYDELIPILTTVVSLWGANKVNAMLSTAAMGKNATSVLASALAYKQQYAAQLVVMSQTRTLTAEENALIGSQTRLSASEYALLGANKMLTRDEAALVIATKNLTKEEAIALGASVGMSEAQVIQCQNMSRLEVLTLRASNAFKTLGASLKAAFLNPVTIAISAMFAIWEAYKRVEDKNNEMQERLNTQKTSANEIYRNIASFQNEHTGDIASMDEAGLKNELEDLKGILKEYDPLWQDAFNNAVVDTTTGAVRSLREQVEYLRDEVQNVKDMANDPHNIMGTAETINSRNDNWWNESLLENADDYAKSLDKANAAAKSLTISYGKELRAAISKAASSHADFNKALKDEAETLKVNELGGEQQLKVLERYPEIMKEIKDSLPKANESGIFDSYMEWAKMVNTSEFSKGFSGIFQVDKTQDFKNLDESIKRMITDYRLLIHNNEWDLNDREVKMSVVGDFEKFTDNIKDPVVQQLVRDKWAKAIFYVDWQTLHGDKMTEQLTGWKKELNDLTGNNKQFETIIRQANSYSEAIEGIKKAYKDAKEHIVNDSGILMKIGIQVDTKNAGSNKPANKQDYLHIWDNGGVKDAVIDAYNDSVQTIRDSLGLKAIGVDLDNDNKNTNTSKDTGNKTDTALKKLKNRAKMLKETYEEYKKWAEAFGKDEAIKKLNEGGLFKQLFGGDATDIDVQTFRKKLEAIKNELANMKVTDERTSYLQEILKKMLDINFDESKKMLDAYATKIKNYIEETSKRQGVYDAWFSVTGDEDLSTTMMTKATPMWTKLAQAYRSTMESELSKNKITLDSKFFDVNNNLGMGFFTIEEEQAKKMLGNNTALLDLWKKIHDLITSAGFDFSKKMADVMKNSDNYYQKIQAAQGSYNKEVDKAKAMFHFGKDDFDEKGYNEYIAELTRQLNQNKGKIIVEGLKNSLNWDTIFGNLNNVRMETLDSIELTLETMVRDSKDLDPTNLKTIYELLNKVRDAKVSKEGIFSGITSAKDNLQYAQNYYKLLDLVGKNTPELAKALKELSNVKMSGNMTEYYKLLGSDKKYKFLINGQEEALTLAEYLNRLAQAESNVANNATLMQKNMKQFATRMQTVGKIVNNALGALNMDDSPLGKMISSIGGSFTGITDAISNIDFSKPFFGGGTDNVLNNINSISSVASSIAEIGNSIKQYKEEMIKAQNEYYDSMRANLTSISEDILDRLEKAINNSKSNEEFVENLADAISQKQTQEKDAIDTTISKLQNSLENYVKAGNSVPKTMSEGFGSRDHSVLYNMEKGNWDFQNWNDILSELNEKFSKTYSTIAELFSGLTTDEDALAILEWLQTAHGGALAQNTDLTELVSNLIQLKEEEADLNTTAQLFGSTWDEYKDSFISACQDMSASAEDLADNIYESLNNAIIKTMFNAEFADQLQSIYDYIGEAYQSGSGFSADEIAKIKADSEALSEAITARREQLIDEGLLIDTGESSSTSSSIQGVTEETADVLSALVQGIRLDLSIQRTAVEQIRDAIGAGENTRSLNAIAEAQVLQLQQIATYTERTAVACESLESHLVDVTNGAKAISIQ